MTLWLAAELPRSLLMIAMYECLSHGLDSATALALAQQGLASQYKAALVALVPALRRWLAEGAHPADVPVSAGEPPALRCRREHGEAVYWTPFGHVGTAV